MKTKTKTWDFFVGNLLDHRTLASSWWLPENSPRTRPTQRHPCRRSRLGRQERPAGRRDTTGLADTSAAVRGRWTCRRACQRCPLRSCRSGSSGGARGRLHSHSSRGPPALSRPEFTLQTFFFQLALIWFFSLCFSCCVDICVLVAFKLTLNCHFLFLLYIFRIFLYVKKFGSHL